MDTRSRTPGYRALRKGRCSITGQHYLITTICADRRPRFAEWPQASRVAAALSEQRLWRNSRLHCWVVMPDHLHVMVELGPESLPKLVQRVKAVTSRAWTLVRTGRPSFVWMPGFHDRALRRDEDLRSVARYIIANPVRAGLAESVGGYPYWDAVWLREAPDLL